MGNRASLRGQRRNRFGEPVQTGAILGTGWGWRTRHCNGPCGQAVSVFEIPAGYLDEPVWGAYVCGECKDTAAVAADPQQLEGVA